MKKLSESLDQWGMPIQEVKKKSTSPDEIEAALQFLKDSGLVPTGTGRPTKPSFTPPHSVIWDKDEEVYFLVIDFGGKGDLWEIKPNGDSAFISSFKGEYQAGPGQFVYDDHGNNNYMDRVELKVMQAILDIVNPDWDKPRPGEPDYGMPDHGEA